MERRDLMKTLAAAAAGAVSVQALAADHAHHQHDHGNTPKKYAAVVASSAECLQTGQACLAHCLVLLADGDKPMAACAQSVNELLAACDALMKLAAQESRFTPAMAKVAAEVCAACEKECRKHEKKHAECKACADACAACLKECKKLQA